MTLNFAILQPKSDDTYHVYVRYFLVKPDNKKYITYLKTNIFLYKQQFEQLKVGKLSGNINKELHAKLNDYKRFIETFYERYNRYPLKEDIAKKKKKNRDVSSSIINYYALFIIEEVKEPSRRVWKSTLSNFIQNFVTGNITYYIICDEDFLTLIRLQLESRNLSKGYITNSLILIRKFINYIAKQEELPLIETKIKTDFKKDYYYITEDDIEQILTYGKETTPNQELIKDMIKFNLVIGLRVSEICNIKKEFIVLGEDYDVVKIYEKKKKRYRELPIVDATCKEIIRKYINTNNDYLFNIVKNTFINHHRQFMVKVFEEEYVTTIKTLGTTTDEHKVEKRLLVSNHSYRRYAITNTGKKYGLEVVKQFSGHTNLFTIEKHYLQDRSAGDIFEMMKTKNKAS